MSMCKVFSCVVGRGCLLFCHASFHISRPNLPVIPDVSWLPTVAFQSPIKKRTSFFGVSSKRPCRSSYNLSIQPYWLGHKHGLLWYWMVCHGNEQRSFCHFWDYFQVLHFVLSCWPWWLHMVYCDGLQSWLLKTVSLWKFHLPGELLISQVSRQKQLVLKIEYQSYAQEIFLLLTDHQPASNELVPGKCVSPWHLLLYYPSSIFLS